MSSNISVMHICSDYSKQKLYERLLRAVAAEGLQQFMYVPVRTAAELDVGRIDDVASIGFRYQHLLRPYHRILFRTKVRKVRNDIMAHAPVAECDLVHAHFLYSDGAVALQLKRRLGKPYIVAVRNADLNSFMRLRPDLAGIRDSILREAGHVVFLSPAYRTAFVRRLPARIGGLVEAKAITIPNGLDDDWLAQNDGELNGEGEQSLRLLYVGDFTPNKNIAGIVAALEILRARQGATLTVVGGGGDRDDAVAKLLEAQRHRGVVYLGRISEPARLRAVYRDHDVLVMPSFTETFGVAYVEALSQGVPIVHSKGQGVDGYFEPGTVASAVDPTDPASIAAGVRAVADRLPDLRAVCRREARRFSWARVAQHYVCTYRTMVGR
jgi:L-malate glycosyltransferase